MKREKSAFLKWFSMSRHQRKQGGETLAEQFNEMDIAALKHQRIEGESPNYTHGADKDLLSHLDNLKQEFIGQSELCYRLAQLIVLIRREVDLAVNLEHFFRLWQEEADYLVKHLNTRWLVSAADTFADFSEDPVEQAYALATAGLVNAVKLTETERWLRAIDEPLPSVEGLDMGTKRVALWDGTSAFAVGTDDSLRNLHWRIQRVCQKTRPQPACLAIYHCVFKRLSEHDTVFKRFREAHTRPRTQWW